MRRENNPHHLIIRNERRKHEIAGSACLIKSGKYHVQTNAVSLRKQANHEKTFHVSY